MTLVLVVLLVILLLGGIPAGRAWGPYGYGGAYSLAGLILIILLILLLLGRI